MPRKGQRNPRPCTRCGNPAKEKTTNGVFKGYLRTCDSCFGYHHVPGPNHPNATCGGRRLNEAGYVQVLDPRKKAGSRYILEHRLVMEGIIGRPLERDEVVHHMNGIRDDNRPENLALIGPDDHHEQRTLIRTLQARIIELENKLKSE